MKSWIILLLTVLVCLCGGCARYYYQEDKTFEQCKRDYEECRAELAKRVTNQKAGAYEHKYMEHCMTQKGYTTVTEGKLPLDAKREDPDLSFRGLLYGRRRGIAGALEKQ